mgnify:CR=1 FL=1
MSKKKIALIYGVTGQDGSYLSRFLLSKGYIVHGIKRRSSLINTQRIDDIYIDPHQKTNFYLHYGDLTDSLSISNHINKINPNEIYNLAAQSHVGVSFDVPEYTANVDALGTLRILESIRLLKKENKVKFYQAGTSEMFGSTKPPQNETSHFHPRSPYAVSKVFAHMITVNYREAYNIFACNGILFNHESPYRGETFVTQKIVKGMCAIINNKLDTLYLGNLSAKRDWGHAKDYVEAMWLMMQKSKADDYVISTGKQYSVKEFVNIVAKTLNVKIDWKGKNLNEKGYFNGKVIIKVDKKYFRPTEVESLQGNSKKARKYLKWKPKYTIDKMIKEMIDIELKTYDK